jgi:hypothetical protein
MSCSTHLQEEGGGGARRTRRMRRTRRGGGRRVVKNGCEEDSKEDSGHEHTHRESYVQRAMYRELCTESYVQRAMYLLPLLPVLSCPRVKQPVQHWHVLEV